MEMFTAKDGLTYEIEIDEDSHTIYVSRAGNKVGQIELDEREDDNTGEAYYHICHLALDSCKGLGIGQRCLELHKEIFKAPLTASGTGSGELPDGSHLTGDGPRFIASMRRKGIVAANHQRH